MGFTTEKKDAEKIAEDIKEYEFALIYGLSEMRLCRIAELSEEGFDMGDCVEARFFSGDKELHYFERNGLFRALEVRDAYGGEENVTRYSIARRWQRCGKELLVKEYLDYDEDGQAYVAHTRLCGIE